MTRRTFVSTAAGTLAAARLTARSPIDLGSLPDLWDVDLSVANLEKHRILTVARRGIAAGSAVRVTPTLYNTREELDRLVRAVRLESPQFA